MLKVVQEESESNAHVPAAVGGSLLDELVRAGAVFEKGILVERPDDTSQESRGDQQVA